MTNSSDSLIRVSCGALCRIPHPDNPDLLLLGLSRNMLNKTAEKAARVLKPIGGVLEYDPHALPPYLTPSPENTDKNELRVFLPYNQLEGFTNWFASRRGREITPLRELREELVDEYRVLNGLTRFDVNMHHYNTVTGSRQTDRKNFTGVLTHSFQEMFEVTFRSAADRQKLREASPQSGLYWVTEAQISTNHYDDETSIQARTLLSVRSE